jgi:septum formation protein
MLERAAVAIVVAPPDVDEGAIKRRCRSTGQEVGQTALALATAKAQQVESRFPGLVVIGCDQMLECEGEWLDKPPDMETAARQLARMSGRRHSLVSGAVARLDGEEIGTFLSTAALDMRELSAAFIKSYLDLVGDGALRSVGAYQLEGPGVHLFSRIEGDHFTILGMPLFPLLEFLRERGVILS